MFLNCVREKKDSHFFRISIFLYIHNILVTHKTIRNRQWTRASCSPVLRTIPRNKSERNFTPPFLSHSRVLFFLCAVRARYSWKRLSGVVEKVASPRLYLQSLLYPSSFSPTPPLFLSLLSHRCVTAGAFSLCNLGTKRRCYYDSRLERSARVEYVYERIYIYIPNESAREHGAGRGEQQRQS